MKGLSRVESLALYDEVVKADDVKVMRELCLMDLFFLMLVGCKRYDMNREWIYVVCQEVQDDPDGYLDLWSREHYKSSIITFGKTIQDILSNPELTFGIFSHTRPIAKAFLTQIKREFEMNELLKRVFPDVLWKEPHRESPKWSLDDGIIVKRKTNPKEATVEAWGLVDGQPTSKHYKVLVYDDVVTKESVYTPEQIQKTTEAWALSLNLSSGEDGRKRYIGTRYHTNDTYASILERNAAKVRMKPATDDGTFDGKPVLWSKELFDKKVEEMGRQVASSQLLQNPLADDAMGFMETWVEYYNELS